MHITNLSFLRSIFLRKFSDSVKFGRTSNFFCRDFTCRIPSHIDENRCIYIFKDFINMNSYVGDTERVRARFVARIK